ncbi:hypothetical protein CPB97_003819, partial [Podila verticillata]
LTLSSVEPNKFLSFGNGLFYDLNGSHPLNYEAVRPNVTAGDELDLMMNVTRLRSEFMEYIEIQAYHASQPPACKWYQLSLRHPASTGQVAKYKDHSNIYFYKPGYLVEIRYRPIHIYTDLAPNSKDYNTPLSKMRRSFGFGHLYEDYSYITSITYQPTGDNPVVPKGSYGPYGLPTVATIVLRPESAFETISYSEEKITLQTTLARIGGFLSLIGALIAFFFGMSAISPWGVITLIPCLRQEVSNSFISSNGYRPFTTPLENVKESGSTTEPQTEDVETRYLKERLNQLEQVLSQYYLDGK